MKTMILCGGKGTRLREETEYRPKPMVPIGDKPIIWHIMKTYAAYGHNEFILCLGYKGDVIKNFFRNYLWTTSDVTIQFGSENSVWFHDKVEDLNWKVTLAETGEESMTAYRIKMASKYIGADKTFLLAYGDCVGNVDINASIAFHHANSKICTITAVNPPGRFGELSIGSNSEVLKFNEKPQTEGGYINGGFMVCDRRLIEFLPDDPDMMLERKPMNDLVSSGQVSAFRHNGFWQPMDTYSEYLLLNQMWSSNNAPWKVWS